MATSVKRRLMNSYYPARLKVNHTKQLSAIQTN